VLGFIIGLVVVSQTIYATTMDNLEEFATLKAIGAPRRFILRVVLTQALLAGAVGCAVGLLATYPLERLATGIVPWVYTPWWLPIIALLPTLLMCVLASIVSIRVALHVDPAKVFRA